MKVIATKIISFLLSVCLLISLIPTQVVHATEPYTLKETEITPGNETANIMPMSDTDTEVLTLNVSKNVQISAAGELKYYRFEPDETGFYTFTSSNITSGDPKGWIYNKNWEYMSENDDTAPGNYNFTITYHLIAHTTYYYIAGSYGSTAATYNIIVTNSSAYSPNSIGVMGNRVTIPTTVAYESYALTLTPTVSRDYLLFTQKESGDPKIWIYDSNRQLIDSNDDGAGLSNSRLAVSLEGGSTYYIVVGHWGSNYGRYDLISVTTAESLSWYTKANSVAIRNKETNMHIMMGFPFSENKVKQWTVDTNQSSFWNLRYRNGYYLIQTVDPCQKYIGISSATVGEGSLRLYDEENNNCRWKIYSYSNEYLIFEPVSAPGKIMISPNSIHNQELHLDYLSSPGDKGLWELEPRSNTPLEGQQTSVWCWVTAAKMFVHHYLGDRGLSQEALVDMVYEADFATGTNEGYTVAAIQAYYAYTGRTCPPLEVHQSIRDGDAFNPGIYSEDRLRQFLDDGHILIISRNGREGDSRSHASIICGYTWEIVNGQIKYSYLIYDPYPYYVPSQWDDGHIIVDTVGQAYFRSYDWICGRNTANVENWDELYWEGTITMETEYSDNTIPPW